MYGIIRFVFCQIVAERGNNQKCIGYIGTFTDITEHKWAEKKLNEYASQLEEARNNLEKKVIERTEELKETQEQLVRKEKLAVIGQMAGSVSHELRNPLGVIKNAAYFLNMKMDTIKDEALKDNITLIRREINIVDKIISDLLDFARVKKPVRRKVNLNQLVRETLAKSLIPENIMVSAELAEDMSLISIDPIQVSQIFHNLIDNAAHAMPEGGTLKISTRTTKEAAEVIFIDGGCGITEKDLEKIFEPLFTAKAKGIGLGKKCLKIL